MSETDPGSLSLLSQDEKMMVLGEAFLKELLVVHNWYNSAVRVARTPALQHSTMMRWMRVVRDLEIDVDQFLKDYEAKVEKQNEDWVRRFRQTGISGSSGDGTEGA